MNEFVVIELPLSPECRTVADLFVVRRRYCGWEDPADPAFLADPFRAVFEARPEAEARANELSRWFGRACHPKQNPFHVTWLTPDDADGLPSQELSRVTTLPAFALRDWLLDADFPDDPPKPMPAGGCADAVEWGEWWYASLFGWENADDDPFPGAVVHPYPFTAGQLAHFWEATNRFPFFEVAEVDWHLAKAGWRR